MSGFITVCVLLSRDNPSLNLLFSCQRRKINLSNRTAIQISQKDLLFPKSIHYQLNTRYVLAGVDLFNPFLYEYDQWIKTSNWSFIFWTIYLQRGLSCILIIKLKNCVYCLLPSNMSSVCFCLTWQKSLSSVSQQWKKKKILQRGWHPLYWQKQRSRHWCWHGDRAARVSERLQKLMSDLAKQHTP